MCKQATNLQMFDVIKKQWADLNDIMVLAGCKTTKASEIKKAIQLEIFKSGKRLPNQNYIPIQDLIKYLGVDERRIIKYKITITSEQLNDLSWAVSKRLDSLKNECAKQRNIIESLEDNVFSTDNVVLDVARMMYEDSIQDLKRYAELYEKLKKAEPIYE